MKLRDQVIEKLTAADKPLTLPKLAKSLGLGPRQHPDITRELQILHRERRLHVANGGGWSLLNGGEPVAEPPSARKTSRGRGEIQVRILAELAAGEKTRADLVTALNPEKTALDVDQALFRMRQNGLVVRVRPRVYCLPGNERPESEAPAQQNQAATYPESVKLEARRIIGEAREQRLNGTTAPTVDESPNRGPALPELVPDVLQEAVTPRSDLRDRLLRGADLVLEGKLSKDGAEALVELVDAILAIDLGVST